MASEKSEFLKFVLNKIFAENNLFKTMEVVEQKVGLDVPSGLEKNSYLELMNKKVLKVALSQIKEDFKAAYVGIQKLPKEARFGVYVAYKYYVQLLKKVDKTPAEVLMEKRIRVSNSLKTYLLFESYISYNFKIA